MIKTVIKQLVITILLTLGLSQAAVAAELEGVKLPGTARVVEGGADLVLNGAGVRTRFFFRVYVGALYLGRKTPEANAVINDPGAKRIALHMLRELSAEQFVSALEEGLKKNHSAEQLAKLDASVKQLRAIFDAVKVAKEGDSIYIDSLPGTGTRITVNGAVKGTIAGEEFNRALLRIWFGENPADSDLKKGMLGG
ncbi:MAG: chalcone isomerase family protein [Betaproteobacteria bacterium]|nr:chalcone isomerase family protein [Betaproteobacteria bacterium]